MAVQASRDNSNKPFIIGGPGVSKLGTFVQDADRSGDIEIYTVVAYNPTSGLWEPLTDVTATDGTQFPRGIIMQTITEAEIKAGNVANVPILKGNAIVDSEQLVLENSYVLSDIINVPTNYNTCIEDELKHIGIFCSSTIDTTETA
jgi:hypothetical protein